MYPCSPTTAPRTAGEMQNTQQTYGAVEVAAAAPPKKKLSRKVVVVVAALGRARCQFTAEAAATTVPDSHRSVPSIVSTYS